jgi:hypothetical protein
MEFFKRFWNLRSGDKRFRNLRSKNKSCRNLRSEAVSIPPAYIFFLILPSTFHFIYLFSVFFYLKEK